MNVPKRVGIWIRVSTDMQVKDDSPEHHERRGRAYAEAKGWEVAEVYRLEAVSGKAVMEQPEAKRMLKDIKGGHITGLIFSKLARLARNTKELLDFADIFKQYNADLISLAESIDTSTPAGRLFYTMIAAMATWEREEIADRVAASVPIRAKMGKPLGGAASFGYKWEGNQLVINDEEAPVRKLVYEFFLKFKRKKAVAAELNKQGYRTRNGSLFSDTTVDRLLRDTTAKGQRLANYTKSLGEGKNWVVKPKEEWIVTPCEAIVSEELWNECNDILDTQASKRQKPGPRAVHLLSGYVVCETCGKKMYVYHEKSATYRCKPCKIGIPAADLDEIYHEQLKGFLLTDMDMQEYMEKADGMLQEKATLLEKTRSEAARLSKRMTDLVNMKLDEVISKEAFQREYRPLEEQYNQLETQLPELEAEVDFLRIQNLSSDTVLEEAKNLYERWPKLPFEEKRSIIEVITDSIIIGKSNITINLSYLPTPHAQPSQNGGKKQHSRIPALPFSRRSNAVQRPKPAGYPKELKTIGDHVRKWRIDNKLLQADVAAILHVTESTVYNWEAGTTPAIEHMPGISKMIGYLPVEIDASTLAGKVKLYRHIYGVSQEKFAKIIGVDASTICSLENGTNKPIPKTLEKLEIIIKQVINN